MEVIRSKVLLRALISLFIAGSCVGTTMPMMRRFGARLGMMGRQALRTAQFGARRRVATQAFKPQAFKSHTFIPQNFTQPRPMQIRQAQKSTGGIFSGWFSRLRNFGQRALRVAARSFAQKPNTKTWLKRAGTARGVGTVSLHPEKISLPEELKIVLDKGDWDELVNRLKQGDFENKRLQKAVIDYCVENWSAIDNSIKRLILREFSDASRAFAVALKDNFSCEIKDVWHFSQFLRDLDFKQIDQVTREELASLALKKISLLYSTDSGRACLIELAGGSMKALQEVMTHVQNVSDKEDNLITLLRIQEKRLRGKGLTQSEAYLLAEMRYIIKNDPLPRELLPLQKKIMQKEEDLDNNDYDIFYHAQSADKYFPIALDTFLYSVCTGDQLNDFYFMHTKSKQLEDKNFRNSLIAEGRASGASIRYMLFLNGCLRSASCRPYEQAFPSFFVDNYNAGNTYWNNQGNAILEHVFSNHGLGCYEKFESELGELWREYNALSECGTLYQIAIPSKNVDKTIMLSTRAAMNKTYVTIDGKQTRDMKKIVSVIRDPYRLSMLFLSNYEGLFVALMTYDKHGLMNPVCGAKMFTYMIPTDEQKYQAWQKKWSNLKARIKKHIEDNRLAD